MLVEVTHLLRHYENDPVMAIFNLMNNGKDPDNKLLEYGVYEVAYGNLGNVLRDMCRNIEGLKFEEWPEFEGSGITEEGYDWFNCYGVCDNYQQIFEKCPEIKESTDRYFLVSVMPVRKEEQSPDGGWRWHKWGPYIGDGEPTMEYLYDEPDFDVVYCYHLFEFVIDKDKISKDQMTALLTKA